MLAPFYRLARRIGGVLLTALLPLVAYSQAELSPCGTTEAMQQLLGTAGYENWWTDYQQQLAQLQARHRQPPGSPPVGPRFIVPVVVHIIHDNGSSNISDAQVHDAVRLLNEMYQERHPDTADVIPHFKSRIGNVNLEFRLARLGPTGDCTTGITRHFSPLTHAASNAVKNLPGARWPPGQYFNVWVVNTIASGAAGYAYYPCAAPTLDGIVIRNDYFGSIGTTPNTRSRRYTFPHEVGHYLGLPHTWGSSNTPGPGLGNCNIDDGVADTPNTEGTVNGTCNLQLPACPGDPDPISNVQNVMDYSGACRAMFTQGQAALMSDGIAGGFACRAALADTLNLVQTGVATGQLIPPCLPVAFLTAVGATATDSVQRVCAGATVQFRGEAYNVPPGTPVQFTWYFPGGVPATSTAVSPTVTYPTAGLHSVTLDATTAVGTNSVTHPDYVRVLSTTAGLTTPLVEAFENPQFPFNLPDPAQAWEVLPGNGTTWEHTTAAAAQGTGSVRLRLRNTVAGADYDLISANIVLTNPITRPYLRFKRAYARATATSNDRLTMSISLDCGRTWVTRGGTAIRSATQLATGPVSGVAFVPTAAQWRADSLLVSTTTLPAGSHLMVRFRLLAGSGNALYLDDLQMGARLTGLAAEVAAGVALTVVPNPSDGGDAQVRVSTGATGAATLRLYDATGRLVGQPYPVAATGADQGRDVALRAVAGSLAAGVYLVELTTADGARLTQRALVY